MKKPLIIATAVLTSILVAVNTVSLKAANEDEINSTKTEIHEKMLNTFDYFESVKGEFVYSSNNAGFHEQVTYQVKNKTNNQTGASYIKSKSKSGRIIESSYDGKKVNQINHKTKEYILADVDLTAKSEKLSIKERYKKNENGESEYKYRFDPTFMGIAAMSVAPQEVATGYLEDYSKWEISGSELTYGFDTFVISGTFNDYYKQKHNAETFKLWVHKDTGILLKLEEYDKTGNVVDYLETTDLKINNGFDGTKLKMDEPKDYKKL